VGKAYPSLLITKTCDLLASGSSDISGGVGALRPGPGLMEIGGAAR
jgi:hypothetical protein